MDTMYRALVNERPGSEQGHHPWSGTGTMILCTMAQIAALSSLFNVKLDSKVWVSCYFFLNAVYYALQSLFGDDGYPVRMCRYASDAALGVAISPLVGIGWARLLGLRVPAVI